MDIRQSPLILGFSLGRYFGVSVRISIWFLLLILVLCFRLGVVIGMWASMLLFVSILIHEFAHELDAADGVLDGTPPIADRILRDRWIAGCTDAFDRVAATLSWHLTGLTAATLYAHLAAGFMLSTHVQYFTNVNFVTGLALTAFLGRACHLSQQNAGRPAITPLQRAR